MERVVALAGNPNVGKSTLFNALTGMHQHTGNWPGKTVENARGRCSFKHREYNLIDLPGTYSLFSHSAEEEITRDFICFEQPDAVAVVCDATCLERNLNLVLQVLEVAPRAVVCLNLMDEAAKKRIQIDTNKLSERLGVPVISTIARKRRSVNNLLAALDTAETRTPYCIPYPAVVEEAIEQISGYLEAHAPELPNRRWLSLRLLDADPAFEERLLSLLPPELQEDPRLTERVDGARKLLYDCGFGPEELQDAQVTAIMREAEELCRDTVRFLNPDYNRFDRNVDRILTGKWFAYPTMLLLLALVFWLTIEGANYPSQLLSALLFRFQDVLTGWCQSLGVPGWLHGALVLGVYRVLAWVVSVMLPPMAIFFPLFTLLEDAGYLPRVAYNLDRPFARCRACGKQALTICMGFGCNAVGVTGCRIIDSPRERLLAILTNSFVPCNGRFPILITLLTVFFVLPQSGGSFQAALLLTLVILFCIGMTFFTTWLLSKTFCRGEPSSFTLELPPYRRPQIGKVLVRSVLDRTLFVLGRAAAVAAPAGLMIWVLANVSAGGQSLLVLFASVLDPLGRLMGMDGVILLAFLLGFPANEIVVPIILMTYLAQGTLVDVPDYTAIRDILVQNGWTWATAVCTILFTVLHWPCSTTLLTIKKETGSWRWTLLAAAIPTLFGMVICTLVAQILRLF